MQQFVLKNLFNTSSLLSSRALKIDADDNLRISTLSFGKSSSRIIPLDLMDEEPRVNKRPDSLLLIFSIINLVISGILYFLTLNINSATGQILAGVFLVLSILSLITSYKKPTITYNFFYKNTNAHLFSISESESNKQQLPFFISQLKQRIIDSRETTSEKNIINLEIDKSSEFTDHLDFLYNYGIVDDTTYEILANRIDEKIVGSSSEKKLADVISLPLKSNEKVKKFS